MQGTGATPAATTTNDQFSLALRGYDGTSYLTSGAANVAMVAGSAWSNSNHEAKVTIGVTANGSTTRSTVGTIASTGAIWTIPYLGSSGSASAPSLAFSSDTGTGFYRFGSGVISTAISGVERFRVGNNQFTQDFNSVALGTSPITSVQAMTIHGGDSSQVGLALCAYGGTAAFYGRRADGTAASPTALALDDTIVGLFAQGYEGTTPGFGSQRNVYRINAAEAWTSTAQGIYQDWYTARTGATGLTFGMRLSAGGSLLIGTTTDGMTAGGSLAVTQDFRARQTTDSSSVSTGSAVISGGMGVAKRSFLGTIGSTFKGNVAAGVQDGTAAVAGQVGEVISASVTTYTNYTTTATIQNLTSISLTPGDWMEYATVSLYMNSATEVAAAEAIAYLDDTTASATGAVEGETIAYMIEPASGSTLHVTKSMTFHENISGSKTKYLNGQATFTAGNPQYTCSLKAVRIR
jgi:hypothetical protein